MNHTEVLKRAWHMVWHYRALWIFGVILALTTVSWGMIMLADGDDEGDSRGLQVTVLDGETFSEALRRTVRAEIHRTNRAIDAANRDLDRLFAKAGIPIKSDILAVVKGLVLVLLGLYLIGKVARYVSETALIRMVDDYEETGQRRGVGRGLRLGLSRTAWRLFLIDLLIDVPVILAFVLLFAVVLAPTLLAILVGMPAIVAGSALLTAGLLLLAIALSIVAGVVLEVLKQFFRRACALEGLGVRAAIRRGYRVARQNLKDVGIMGLIVTGLRLIWPLTMLPLGLALLAAAVALGGLPAILAYGLASLAWSGAAPVLVAIAVGLALFFLVLLAPLLFLEGLLTVFLSSAWTLTYRRLGPAEKVATAPAAGRDLPTLEVVTAAH